MLWSFLNNDLNMTIDLDKEQAKPEPDLDSEIILPYHPKEVVHMLCNCSMKLHQNTITHDFLVKYEMQVL